MKMSVIHYHLLLLFCVNCVCLRVGINKVCYAPVIFQLFRHGHKKVLNMFKFSVIENKILCSGTSSTCYV